LLDLIFVALRLNSPFAISQSLLGTGIPRDHSVVRPGESRASGVACSRDDDV